MHSIQALLFDLDGTLVDTAEANYSAYSRALAEFGVQAEPHAIARIAADRQWRVFLPELLRDANVEADPARIAHRKGELYRAAIAGVRVNSPLVALLRCCHRVSRLRLTKRVDPALVPDHHTLPGWLG